MRASSYPPSFNPNTATLVAAFDNIGPSFYTNYHFASERLYINANGKWFLEGEGGAMTRLGRANRNGPAIAPISRPEAYEWLVKHGESEAIQRYF